MCLIIRENSHNGINIQRNSGGDGFLWLGDGSLIVCGDVDAMFVGSSGGVGGGRHCELWIVEMVDDSEEV
jgi:hypothetical protein